jgi:phosphohistidine phosphatase
VIVTFLRHGPAFPAGTPGFSEEDRPLTPQGRRKTLRAARGIARLTLGIDGVITSPLARAHETARIVSEALGLGPSSVSEKLLPETPPADLLDILSDLPAEALLLVGHEPSLSSAVGLLLGADERAPVEFKKAGLAVVRLRRLAPRPEGTLAMLLTPAVLRRLGR